MTSLVIALNTLITLYILAILFRVLLEILPVKWPDSIKRFSVFVYDITDPPLRVLRRFIPVIPMSSGMSLDLSPTILVLLLIVLNVVLANLLG